MFKIRTYDNISPEGLAVFPLDRYETASETPHPEGIMVRSSKLHDLEFPETLLAIARAGVGVDNIPLERCTKKGIAVFNTPGANANAVCELVLSAMLLSSRRLAQGMAFCQTLKGSAEEVSKASEKGKKNFGGQELLGRTLGVVGLGAIGGRVANAAMGLGMKIIGFDPWLSVENALQLPREIVRTEYLQELVQKSDYITLHVPLFDNTKNLIGEAALKNGRPGVRILNFSRDGIVDNEAVLKAIAAGKVACYATDFARPELLGNDKILCFPHLGASTEEAERNCAVMAAEHLRGFLEHGNVAVSVNYPQAVAPRTTSHRLTVFTENVPGMVGKISGLLGAERLNIAELINKSRGEVAYNLIDLDAPCPEGLLAGLRRTPGIIAARVIGGGA